MPAQTPLAARRPPTAALAVIVALFAGIFVLELVASEPLTLWGVLYAVPVLLAARRTGRGGGLAAAGLATVLIVVSAQIEGFDVDAVAHLSRAATFFAVGSLVVADAGLGVGGEDASGTVLTADAPVGGSPPGDPDVRRREALKLSGVATWELDLATGEMQWSDEYQELYGVDPRTPLTSRAAFQQMMVPEDRGLFLHAIDSIAADGTTLEIRYRIIRPDDGAEHVIRSHIRAQDDAGGERRLIGTAQDVTQLVRILTPRESEMLLLLADGLSGEQIAERLVLSPATVRTHVQNAMVKLGSNTRGQAIATALRSNEIGS